MKEKRNTVLWSIVQSVAVGYKSLSATNRIITYVAETFIPNVFLMFICLFAQSAISYRIDDTV